MTDLYNQLQQRIALERHGHYEDNEYCNCGMELPCEEDSFWAALEGKRIIDDDCVVLKPGKFSDLNAGERFLWADLVRIADGDDGWTSVAASSVGVGVAKYDYVLKFVEVAK